MSNKTVLIQSIHFIYNLLDDEIKAMLDVIGEFFDAVEAEINTILAQFYPGDSLADGMLPDYERFYQCPPQSGDTEAIRRERVLSVIRAKGDFNKAVFYRIADALGYAVGAGDKYLTISEGLHAGFLADIGRADIDEVSDIEGGEYDVVISGTDVETDTELQYRFNKQKLYGINLIFVNV